MPTRLTATGAKVTPRLPQGVQIEVETGDARFKKSVSVEQGSEKRKASQKLPRGGGTLEACSKETRLSQKRKLYRKSNWCCNRQLQCQWDTGAKITQKSTPVQEDGIAG